MSEIHNIPSWVKIKRLENGWSVQQLADRAGCSRMAIYDIENGTIPRLGMLQDIAAAFGGKIGIRFEKEGTQCTQE